MYNGIMKNIRGYKQHIGFTIIEVMIFLAISGVLIIGIIAGSGVTVARHRYNDSVQDFAQLLREQYSSVINTQIPLRDQAALCYSTGGAPDLHSLFNGNSGFTEEAFDNAAIFNPDGTLKDIPFIGSANRGRTDCAVYGRIVTLEGSDIKSKLLVGKDYAAIRDSYDPGPDGTPFGQLSDLQLLSQSGITGGSIITAIRTYDNKDLNPGQANTYRCGLSVAPPPQAQVRSMKWGTSMTLSDASNPNVTIESITLLIFRSPQDGAIRTYVLNGSILPTTFTILGGNQTYSISNPVFLSFNNKGNGNCQGNSLNGGDITNQGQIDDLFNQLSISSRLGANLSNVRSGTINICISNGDSFALGGARRLVRIAQDGHNSSAVELIEMDSEDNICNQ